MGIVSRISECSHVPGKSPNLAFPSAYETLYLSLLVAFFLQHLFSSNLQILLFGIIDAFSISHLLEMTNFAITFYFYAKLRAISEISLLIRNNVRWTTFWDIRKMN